MEQKEMKISLAGRELKITNGPFSSYADGFALVSLGDTIVMANASMSKKGKEGADFFPMVVDYEENFYAAGKIKGSRFVKRAGRPSENATLVSRLIDRPMRPLFPKGVTNEVQIICSVLSADLEVDPSTTAINAASIALMLSGAPFDGPVASVRMGYKDGQLIVNPTYQECSEGLMDLIVAGTMDAITMVEAGMKEVSEEIILDALQEAHKHIKTICQLQIDYAKQFDIKAIEPTIVATNEDAVNAVKALVTDEMLDGIKGPTKKDVKAKIEEIEDALFAKYAAEIEEGTFSKSQLAEILNSLMEKRMRKNILEKEMRLDGRALNEVRPISVVTDVLPRTHGSALFQRGETMSLTITTLGSPGDAQIVDTMEADITKRYFHHYHFPPFSTGDIKMLRGPGRREIGHGDLAERALVPVLPSESEFPYTIWAMSEITRCNGSSSMASVCGSTLSMMAAGVPLKRPVAGIAMGLVTDPETGAYKILTDIQGMEDFAGDMDFKAAGTSQGITSLQMDIKIKGLSIDLMRDALSQAKVGRDFIMNKMLEALPEPRKELSKYAPLIMSYQIDPEMIGLVIGKGGETIQGITKECEVEIDINDNGVISITAPDQERGNKALEWIKRITYTPKVGDVFDGKVTRLMEFGAFVEILPGKEGLVHISELANTRVNKVSDVVAVGDPLKVKLIKVDEQKRLNLSHKALLSDTSHSSHGGVGGGSSAAHVDIAHADDMPQEQKAEMHGEAVPGTRAVRKVNGN